MFAVASWRMNGGQLPPPIPSRGAVERFGLLAAAAGIVIATLGAWGMRWFMQQTDWDTVYDVDGWTVYTRHPSVELTVYAGIGMLLLGIVLVLVGKALRHAA